MRLTQLTMFSPEPSSVITCDVNLCPAMVEADTPEAAVAKATARGWLVTPAWDACPNCRGEEPKP